MTSTGTYTRSTFSMSTAPINKLYFNGALHLHKKIMRIGVIVFIKDDRKTGVASIPHCSY